MLTPAAEQALQALRNPSQLHWSTITLLLLVLYVYFHEIDRGRWDRVWAGLAFWGMDLFNETWNALVLHFSGRAPVWSVAGHSSYQPLIGLNVEICLMFAVSGIAATLALPADPRQRLLGLPNRWTLALGFSALSVLVEMGLNRLGLLRWDWPWWNADAPWLIFLLGYLPFYAVCYWVLDMRSRRQQVTTVAVILGLDALALLVFGRLGWI